MCNYHLPVLLLHEKMSLPFTRNLLSMSIRCCGCKFVVYELSCVQNAGWISKRYLFTQFHNYFVILHYPLFVATTGAIFKSSRRRGSGDRSVFEWRVRENVGPRWFLFPFSHQGRWRKRGFRVSGSATFDGICKYYYSKASKNLDRSYLLPLLRVNLQIALNSRNRARREEELREAVDTCRVYTTLSIWRVSYHLRSPMRQQMYDVSVKVFTNVRWHYMLLG